MEDKNINIALPGLYSNFHINKLFVYLFRSKKDLFIDGINIDSVYGSFPSNFWGLERFEKKNIKLKKLQDIIDFYKKNNIKISFELDNPYIRQEHLNNKFINQILKLNENNQAKIILNSQVLFNYIKEYYGNYLIESTNKDIKANIYEITKQEINSINNIKIQNCIIALNDFCESNCKYKTEHIKYLGYEQIMNKEITPYFPCKMNYLCDFEYIKKHDNFVSIEEMKGIVKNTNINNFKIKSNKLLKYLQQYCNLSDLVKFYIYYLIKPEFKEMLQNHLLCFIVK